MHPQAGRVSVHPWTARNTQQGQQPQGCLQPFTYESYMSLALSLAPCAMELEARTAQTKQGVLVHALVRGTTEEAKARMHLGPPWQLAWPSRPQRRRRRSRRPRPPPESAKHMNVGLRC